MELLISLVILVFSAIIHEVSHGFVADKLGDPTARLSGRLTLNPKSHIDPFMSLLLPLILILSQSPVIFGAAKPVPIDPYNLKEGRKDIALVALSGPLANIFMAIGASLILKIFYLPFIIQSLPILFVSVISFFLFQLIQINLLLAVFNLLPIPPLDGSKVFAMFLPETEARIYMSLESIGIFLLFFLLLFQIGGFSLGGLIFKLVSFSQGLLLP